MPSAVRNRYGERSPVQQQKSDTNSICQRQVRYCTASNTLTAAWPAMVRLLVGEAINIAICNSPITPYRPGIQHTVAATIAINLRQSFSLRQRPQTRPVIPNLHPIPFLLLTATFRVQFMFFFLKKLFRSGFLTSFLRPNDSIVNQFTSARSMTLLVSSPKASSQCLYAPRFFPPS